MDAFAPAPARGEPVVVSGGQPWAHAPEQVLDAPWSFAKRYSVRPSGPTSTVPTGRWRLLTTAAPPGDAPAVPLCAGGAPWGLAPGVPPGVEPPLEDWLLPPPDPPPHPAAATA